MPRSFGRVLASIWDDEDFRDTSPLARLVYIFLFSQTDLNHAGIMPVCKPRWEDDLALAPEDLGSALAELAGARFIVIDERKCELLVRSLIRNDEIWKQPNVFKAAAASARTAKSAAIKTVLLSELRRLDLSSASAETRSIRDELLTHLEPFGNPSPGPLQPVATPPVGPPQPSGNGSAGGPGEGNGNGPVLQVSPKPDSSPSPRGRRGRAADPGPGVRPLIPFGLPGAEPGEEGESQHQDQPDQASLDALVAEIRRLRSEWSAKSILKVLADPEVNERPWPVVRAAALIVARDPATRSIGRLREDGPWWAQAAVSLLPARPTERPHCDVHLLEEPCRSCAADRKVGEVKAS